MTCPQYILSDDEITTINANFLMLDNAINDLRVIIGVLPIERNGLGGGVFVEISRIDLALNNLRPLVTHLFKLQGKNHE